MDLFRKKKNKDSSAAAEEASGDSETGTAENPNHSRNDSAVDIIVDSDNEAEIFDDDEDDDEGGIDKDVSTEVDGGIKYSEMIAAVKPLSKKATADREDETGSDDESDHDTETEEDDAPKDKKDGNGSDSGEDYTDDEDEGADGYKQGGYHPVKVGEVYNQR